MNTFYRLQILSKIRSKSSFGQRRFLNNITKNLTLNSQIDYWNGQKKTISREGKGMNPRIENGSTRQIQTGAIINPNNGPPILGGAMELAEEAILASGEKRFKQQESQLKQAGILGTIDTQLTKGSLPLVQQRLTEGLQEQELITRRPFWYYLSLIHI